MLSTPLRALAAFIVLVVPAAAQSTLPSATRYADELLPDGDVQQVLVEAVDLDLVRAEDEARAADGLPFRYAVPNEVSYSPFTDGTLELVNDELVVWRLRVHAPLARTINLGFGQYRMTEGGQLLVYSEDRMQVVRPFTAADNHDHGELWTPILVGDRAVIELTLPAEEFDDRVLALELTHVGYGYRGIGSKDDGADSGSCNVDVVCSDGDDWREEIPAIGGISTGGSVFCTGFMVNNTANDRRALFMTADHCGIGPGNAASLVVYWNYETSVCDGTPDGLLNQFTTGSTHLASYGPSDFTIVELSSDPDPDWGITYAGWDRSGADEPGAIAIHHPSGDEKRISFENDSTTTTSYLGTPSPGNGTHIRVEDWDLGTTEPGSSGSPLFNPEHQVVGQLHGGYAACGNNSADWYGKLSVSWTGGGTSSTRLSDWLDPLGTGATSVDTLGTGLAVSPSGDVAHDGPVGGPYSNASTIYTLSNSTPDPISYKVSLTSAFGMEIDGAATPLTGVLAANGGSVAVEVSFGAAANALGAGLYSETVLFEDLTNGLSTTRQHDLEVGRRTIYSFNLDTDPGWTTEGDWEWGVPQGGGGLSNGLPDPTSGATGSNVYGYNLAGDYTDNMTEQHLISLPLNLTGATGVKVRYKRWLNTDVASEDHAFFRVSNDGVVFGRVWSNVNAIVDSSWIQEEFDISALADGQSTVYLRWTQGVTDGADTFSGWNIDDIEISAIAPIPFQNYADGLAGSGGLTPTLTGTGSTSTNDVFNVTVANGLGGASSYLLFGLTQDNLPAAGGAFVVNNLVATIHRLLSNPAGGAGAGVSSLNFAITDPSLVGISLYLQALTVDPGAPQGIAFTDGLHLFADY